MSSVRSLYKDSFIYGLSTVVPKLLNYLLVPLHTYIFKNPQQYGIVNELYAYLTFLLILMTFGLETGYFRFVNKHKNSENIYTTVFYFLVITSVAFFLFFCFSANSIASSLGSLYHPLYITTLAGVISLDAMMAIPFAKLRNDNRPILFSFLKIIGVVVNVLLNIIFYLVIPRKVLIGLIPGVDIIYYIFLSNLVQNVVLFLLVMIFTGLPKIRIKVDTLKEILKYSLPLLVAGLAGTTNEAFDRIFIKYLIPDTDKALYLLGIYGANVKLGVILVLFTQMYRFAAEPFFFKINNNEEHNKVYGKSLKYFILFCVTISILISFNLPILKYFIGSNYRNHMSVVIIMLVANSLSGIFFNLSFWYKLTDKTMYGLKYVLIGAGSTIILNFILIPLINIYGAALSRLVSYAIMVAISYYEGRNTGLISLEKKNLKKYALILGSIVLISVLVYLLNPILAMVFVDLSMVYFVLTFMKSEKIKLNGSKS
ncbi:MAG: oligosaccharide flippase family protein [Bacteroidales bacterium]|nr:oligosaccharide flippase family protein [Bacteroidales bacterium]HPD94723.1 oligosaccharide flippase family protein [Tenuifilaceae bacterium]HRX31219.1 oligosaccharide flippase family protein [Tenuifilaceae bacterium]